ncbi:multicopper oxidase family protein [Blastopirellula marina]|uniref:Copper oxidase n=1 Tax=Blastopirellula marina TaxID=124 RepID=A0A2S8FNC3_9BACT|nr:multicopper oxidase domain-containing protein [Blastopirellula marina]PQO33695.1 copper oxidase [Blastopirellula marina]PTL43482.1 copper oxidase [Blastopirellula marina]
MKRRDMLKGVAASVVGSTVVASGQELDPIDERGPFASPTARFKKGSQHVLPDGAFTKPLFLPPVPLPTCVDTFDQLHEKPVFGQEDETKLGHSFHGIAREWGETPKHWEVYGCDPSKMGNEAWDDKRKHFGTIPHYLKHEKPVGNWSGFKPKCYKIPIMESYHPMNLKNDKTARLYSFAGMVPGPTLKMRLGEPVVVRFVNHLEAETSVHLHGGHSPSHSDGFPTFYVLQSKARDYFYPNIVPLYKDEEKGLQPDIGETQSTMWYHDHAMDATAYNVSKGLAAFALFYGDEELKLIHDRVLPGYGPDSCLDPTSVRYDDSRTITAADLKKLEDPQRPGFYANVHEPYRNPFDIPLVLQDKVIDHTTGQVAYDLTSHDGYLGDTFFVNGVPWPRLEVRNRKYRFRILDGSNARVYRLRIMTAEDFEKANQDGITSLDGGMPTDEDSGDFRNQYDKHSQSYLRIGKDSWLWSKALKKQSTVLAMANRADLVVDFGTLAEGLKPGETREFVLVNTMPQFDGRGPKPKLEDGGDPRVLPAPFDIAADPPNDIRETPLVELNRPIGLMKFVVCYGPPRACEGDPAGDCEASVKEGTPLATNHRDIPDAEVVAVREFIFERGKGAWQINGRFYDPFIANAAPRLGGAEEWILRNGGGGWWHPIHIHLESHQLLSYEKDFEADQVVDRAEPPARVQLDLERLKGIVGNLDEVEAKGLHDTQILGPNTVARIRIRTRTWNGPFVFHCHNLEHEDMRMMFNFEPVPGDGHDPNVAPAARTHGNDLTLNGKREQRDQFVGELEWEYAAIPRTPVADAGEEQIPPRPPEGQ